MTIKFAQEGFLFIYVTCHYQSYSQCRDCAQKNKEDKMLGLQGQVIDPGPVTPANRLIPRFTSLPLCFSDDGMGRSATISYSLCE